MKLLDLFCGAGGCSMGYHRAGFECVGVDNRPMPRYPFEFHQADALEYLREHGHEFDAIHASPPCQAFSSLRFMWNSRKHPDLVDACRSILDEFDCPYVIENVPGAPLRNPVMLCGTMFNLRTSCGAELWRHRMFELRGFWILTPPCRHRTLKKVIGVYGGHGKDNRRVVQVNGHAGGKSVRDGTQGFSTAARREAMGIDWMTSDELSQAIPPAYTEFIGKHLMDMCGV